MIHSEAVLYSLDSSVTLTDIKQGEIDLKIDGSELIKRMEHHKIQTSIVGKWWHFKFEKIKSPPYILYHQWDIWHLDFPMIAIVWPRKMSWYQERVLRDFFDALRKYNVVTISGWAPGVDSLCHELSIQSGIPTIMVLGAWFRHYLESSKRHLLSHVLEAWWCVISEFRLWQWAAPRTFPQRNRIIAWLADTVFLPGAAAKSGSLITVDFAHSMHVPVCGVPGSIYDASNHWTNEYAFMWKMSFINSFEQYLDTYFTKKQEWNAPSIISELVLTQEQEAILSCIQSWKNTLQGMVHMTWYDVSTLLVHLSEMELFDLITQDAGGERWIK